jgi:hypothetical protein
LDLVGLRWRCTKKTLPTLLSVHPETLPKLKLWTPRCPLFGVQSFSFGIFKAVPGWTLLSVHPETPPKLKRWTPRCPLFGVQSFSFGIFKAVSGWTLLSIIYIKQRSHSLEAPCVTSVNGIAPRYTKALDSKINPKLKR